MPNAEKPPRSGWAPLVTEVLVTDIAVSQAFWVELLGFAVAFARPEQKFLYLERPEGAQIMLCQRAGKWETATLEQPFGRGVMFQIAVDGIKPIQERLNAAGWQLHAGPREVWRRTGDRQSGSREIFVQDPDGYLVMLAEDLGERPLDPAA